MNLLIADSDFLYIKNLINYIGKRDNFIKIVNVATNGNEILEGIKNKNIDLLLLDSKIQKYSILKIFDNILEFKLKYNIHIIILSNDIGREEKRLKYKNAIDIIDKSIGIEKIYEEIKKITKSENQINYIRKKVMNQLIYLGFNIKHSGTQYLYEAITLIYEENIEILVEGLENYIYERIAKKYNKSKEKIKNNIFKSINYMYITSDFEKIKTFFNLHEECKPTPRLIILTFIQKLKQIKYKN